MQAGLHLPSEDAAQGSAAEAASIERSAKAQGLNPSSRGEPGAWLRNDLFD